MSFLMNEQDRLDGKKICECAGNTIPLPELYATIDSTNIRAKELAAIGALKGSAVLADAQDASLGEFGGIEMNDSDCLLFHSSFILQFPLL